jgi:signal recognition particle GTPase
LQNIFKNLRGKGRLSEADVKAALKEVKLALLEADVNFKVVKQFIKSVEERAIGQDVMSSLTPGQMVIKIVNEEMVSLMGSETTEIALKPGSEITVIMMAGLQGAGKTTTTAKLAGKFKAKGRKPLLVACDVYRPAAIEQLTINGNKQGVEVFSMGTNQKPVDIAKAAIAHAKNNDFNTVILDTAGRLHVDKEYAEALKRIKADLALEVWMKKIYDAVKVDAKDVKDYYDKNADKFMQPATVKARHVLVKTEQEAKDVIKELDGLSGQKLNDKFVELATTKSTGPSGQGGGELGWFAANQMVKPFSDAAFALKKGEITKTPVQTQFGFHVILVEDTKPAEKATFEAVKPQIENGLKMEKFRIQVADKAQTLRKNAKVTIK